MSNKFVILACCMFSIIACNDSSVQKPDNLIDRDKMVDILYDVSLLEAIKSQNLNGGISSQEGNEYIYKKYKIDSLQFVKSNKYYASDIDGYHKMVEEVKERLNNETKKIGGSPEQNHGQLPPNPNSTENSDTPQVQ